MNGDVNVLANCLSVRGDGLSRGEFLGDPNGDPNGEPPFMLYYHRQLPSLPLGFGKSNLVVG